MHNNALLSSSTIMLSITYQTFSTIHYSREMACLKLLQLRAVGYCECSAIVTVQVQ